MRNQVLIIGNFIYPDGNASGKRVKGIEDLFIELGYETHLLSLPNKDYNYRIGSNRSSVDFYETQNDIKKWFCFEKYRNRVVNEIIRIGIENIAFLYIYSCPTLAIAETSIIRYCKKNNIKTITDCVDWIEISNERLLITNIIKFLNCNYEKRIANCKADGTIVVSSYLKNYYQHKQQPVCVIPPVMDTMKNKKEKREVFRFLYAGHPFSLKKGLREEKFKDRLDIIIDLVIYLNDHGVLVELDVYGITREEYCIVVQKHNSALCYGLEYIRFHGIRRNTEVLEATLNSDYVILFRNISKITSAGFPSKVCEANNCGVPVISNDTGDIGMYLSRNDCNIILPNNVDEAKELLFKILDERRTSEADFIIEDSEFSIDKFVNDFSAFINSI